MTNIMISFEYQQVQMIEQIVMDRDEHGAIEFLEELRNRIQIAKSACNPLEFRTRESVEGVIKKVKKCP